MSKIDTSTWMEFKVGDLFSPVRGKAKSMQLLEDGPIPVIAAARQNQGIAKYGNIPEEYSDEITISCNGAGCGSTFYHDGPFAISGDAMVLQSKIEIPKQAKIYLAAIMDAMFTKKYSYEDKISPDKVVDEILLLPYKTVEEPDWEYMEEYMKEIMDYESVTLQRYIKLNSALLAHHIDTWDNIKLTELGFSIFHGQRLVKTDRIAGNTPFITAGEMNQGVSEYIGNNWPTYENPITVDMFGNVFYHDGLVSGDDNVYFFVNSCLSKEVKQFIVTSISKQIKEKFSYTHQFRQSDADNLTVCLPMKNCSPDLEYMQAYMSGIYAAVERDLDIISIL